MGVLVKVWLVVAVACAAWSHAGAATIRVAVATNFAAAIEDLAEQFERRTGHEVILALGSTGKHYAQIRNGAPFDLFLAADRDHPELLEKEGLAVAGSRFTYAIGKLVLYSPDPARVDATGKVLTQGEYRFLAIANPRLAPYGRAAREVLESLALWQSLQGKMVRGENIGQALQFVASGNAELGFVAWSQIVQNGRPLAGSWWLVPADLYSPIEQQAVMLTEEPAASAFADFLRSADARLLIRSHGYEIPDDQ